VQDRPPLPLQWAEQAGGTSLPTAPRRHAAAAALQIRPGQDDRPAVGAVEAEGQGAVVGVEGGDGAALPLATPNC
jgi:hypothetical protein